MMEEDSSGRGRGRPRVDTGSRPAPDIGSSCPGPELPEVCLGPVASVSRAPNDTAAWLAFPCLAAVPCRPVPYSTVHTATSGDTIRRRAHRSTTRTSTRAQESSGGACVPRSHGAAEFTRHAWGKIRISSRV